MSTAMDMDMVTCIYSASLMTSLVPVQRAAPFEANAISWNIYNLSQLKNRHSTASDGELNSRVNLKHALYTISL
jgi:hypothetical protein